MEFPWELIIIFDQGSYKSSVRAQRNHDHLYAELHLHIRPPQILWHLFTEWPNNDNQRTSSHSVQCHLWPRAGKLLFWSSCWLTSRPKEEIHISQCFNCNTNPLGRGLVTKWILYCPLTLYSMYTVHPIIVSYSPTFEMIRSLWSAWFIDWPHMVFFLRGPCAPSLFIVTWYV